MTWHSLDLGAPHRTRCAVVLGGGQILETEMRAETDKSTGVTVNKPYYNIHYQGWKDRCLSPPHHLHPFLIFIFYFTPCPITHWGLPPFFLIPKALSPSKQNQKD